MTSGVESPAPGPGHQRDRFVAFAFAAAEILIEADSNRRIVFAAGATESMLGEPAQRLVGRPLESLVAPATRPFFNHLLGRCERGGRVEAVAVELVDAKARPQHFELSGYCVPNLGNHFFLSLGLARLRGASEVNGVDAESGLADRGSFLEIAERSLREEASKGQPTMMTMLDMGQVEQLRARLPQEIAGELAREIGARLRADSIDGFAAGRLDDDKFGLVHRPSVDLAKLSDEISALVARLDPSGTAVKVTATSLDLDAPGLDDADALRVLADTINRFVRGDPALVSGSLAESYDRTLAALTMRATAMRSIIGEKRFTLVYQPIVELAGGAVHHWEALSRFDPKDGFRTPADAIIFAEDNGLIGRFDLVVCQRVIDVLIERRAGGAPVSIAVNLSGHSLGQASVIKSLHDLLERHQETRQHLMFEVTESSEIKDLVATNRVLQGLRTAGHRVCLDDFGQGAAAFHYLRALEVDLVKIDGAYVRDAVADRQSRSFLKAMAVLCTDLGIDTVAEMVEDEATAKLLAEIGVRFAQGYYFGRPQAALPEQPSSDIARTPAPPTRYKVKKAGGAVVMAARKFGRRKGPPATGS